MCSPIARALCLVVFAIAGRSTSLAAGNRPNILVIVGDDMGYADVGVHGCQDIPTPHLDALANSGVRFTNGYVSGPYCSPTRAGLLTGRYQTRFGHEFNAGGGDRGLPVSEKTIADRLKTAGYATGIIGKWHLGDAPEHRPLARGFDEFFGFLGGGHSYFPGEGAPIYRGEDDVEEKAYLTDAFAREAVDYIDRHQDEPFFLYLAFNAVHTPMHADDARLKKFAAIPDKKRRTYAAMMSAMDDAVGEVMKAVRDKGLAENTLVFFFSDHGGPTMKGTTTNASINTPLRGSKRTTLEGGVRVPFFLSWPGHVPAGKLYDHPVIQLDVFPMAMKAAGAAVPADAKLEGVDLVPYLTGENPEVPHDALYWRFGQQMAIRKGDWKLVAYDPVIDGGRGKATPKKLYHLANDLGEEQDLAASEPEKVQELQASWDKWNQSNVPPKWGARGRVSPKRGFSRSR